MMDPLEQMDGDLGGTADSTSPAPAPAPTPATDPLAAMDKALGAAPRSSDAPINPLTLMDAQLGRQAPTAQIIPHSGGILMPDVRNPATYNVNRGTSPLTGAVPTDALSARNSAIDSELARLKILYTKQSIIPGATDESLAPITRRMQALTQLRSQPIPTQEDIAQQNIERSKQAGVQEEAALRGQTGVGGVLKGMGQDVLSAVGRPFQVASTGVSGIQRAVGEVLGGNAGLTSGGSYGPMDIPKAMLHTLLTGETPAGFEQPVGEAFKLLIEKMGGDPHAGIAGLDPLALMEAATDPVNYGLLEEAAKLSPKTSGQVARAGKAGETQEAARVMQEARQKFKPSEGEPNATKVRSDQGQAGVERRTGETGQDLSGKNIQQPEKAGTGPGNAQEQVASPTDGSVERFRGKDAPVPLDDTGKQEMDQKGAQYPAGVEFRHNSELRSEQSADRLAAASGGTTKHDVNIGPIDHGNTGKPVTPESVKEMVDGIRANPDEPLPGATESFNHGAGRIVDAVNKAIEDARTDNKPVELVLSNKEINILRGRAAAEQAQGPNIPSHVVDPDTALQDTQNEHGGRIELSRGPDGKGPLQLNENAAPQDAAPGKAGAVRHGHTPWNGPEEGGAAGKPQEQAAQPGTRRFTVRQNGQDILTVEATDAADAHDQAKQAGVKGSFAVAPPEVTAQRAQTGIDMARRMEDMQHGNNLNNIAEQGGQAEGVTRPEGQGQAGREAAGETAQEGQVGVTAPPGHVALEKVNQEGDKHFYQLKDDQGRVTGAVHVNVEPGNPVGRVDWLEAGPLGGEENALGRQGLRDVLAGIKQEHPDLERVTGTALSGEKSRNIPGAERSLKLPEGPRTEAAPLAPSPEQSATKPPADQGVRQTPLSLEASSLLGGRDRNYDIAHNPAAEAKANAEIASKGRDAVLDAWNRGEYRGADQTTTGTALVREFQEAAMRANDPIEHERLLRQTVDTASELARRLTESGQTVQAASLISNFSPEGAIRMAQRIVERSDANARLPVKIADQITTLTKAIASHEATISDLSKQIGDMQAKMGEGTRQAPLKTPRQAPAARARLFSDAQAAADRDFLKTYWDTHRGSGGPGTDYLTAAARLGAYHLESGVKNLAEWADKMVQDLGERVRPYLKDIYRDSYEKWDGARRQATEQKIQEAAAKKLGGTPTQAQIDGLIAKQKAERAASQAAKTQLGRTFQNLQKTSRLTAVVNFGKAAKIAGLPSLAKHVGSVLGYGAMNEIARVPASIVDMTTAAARGTERTLAGASLPAMGRASWDAITNGSRDALQIMKHGMTDEQAAQLQVGRENNLGVPVLDHAINYVFRTRGAVDAIAMRYLMRRSLEDQAKVLAMNESKAGRLTGTVADRTKQLVATPTPEMQALANQDALVGTFKNDNPISSGFQKFKTSLGPTGKNIVELAVPFDKTPTNVVLRVLEASPGGMAYGTGKLIADIRKAGFTPEAQRAFATTIGKSATGTAALFGLGYTLAKKGLVIGAPSDQERKKRADQGLPLNPAINVGGRWVSIDPHAGPLGAMLGMGATIYESEKNGEGSTLDRGLAGGAKAVKHTLLEQPLLREFKDIGDALDAREKKHQTVTGTAAAAAGGFTRGFIPAEIQNIAKAMDPKTRANFISAYMNSSNVKYRKPQGFLQNLEVGVPGLRQKVQEAPRQ